LPCAALASAWSSWAAAALALLGLISLGNALLLVAVIASLIQGDEKSGAQLLFKALIVWNSNVITYGLW
jgi:hypothetical protein